MHPPQHLKDQLLQNGKNNLVLRQVAIAMMQQQQQNPSQQNPVPNQTTAALLAANVIQNGGNPPLAQYATFANNPSGAQHAINHNAANNQTTHLINASTLANAGLVN